jgi:ATP-binding cassette subfamily C protein
MRGAGREAAEEPKPTDAAILQSGVLFLREFIGFARWSAVRAAAAVAMAALLENVGIVLLVPFLSLAMDEKAAPEGALTTLATPVFALLHAETRLAKLTLLLAVFTLLLLLRGAAGAAQMRILTRLRTDYIESRRARLLEALATASWDRVLGLSHARVQRAINDDVTALGGVVRFPLDAGAAALMLLAQAAFAAWLAPLFAALCLALVAAAGLLARPLLRRSYGIGRALASDHVALAHSLGQFLGALKLAISQNLQKSFVAEFEAAIADLKRRQIAYLLQQSNSQQAMTVVSGVVAMICAFVGLAVLDLPAPLVFGLLLILARISGPVQQIVRSAQQFVHGLPSFERVRRLERELSAGTAPAAAPAAAPGALDGPIVFSGVTFRHGADGGGIADVDVAIAPGEILGVTGPSGAGKTTFADLLVGLIPPQSGTIRVGGRELAGPALAAWRGALSYVAQDAFLFHDSLRRNLLWAAPAATEADIWRALSLAGADALTRRLPAGLDTIVGERGALFSGGERQRFALARAILRAPRLLVLDEATSALDVPSEQALLTRLRELDPTPTMVIIAHRRESLRLCQRLLIFEDGRLARIEDGPARALSDSAAAPCG